MDVAAAAVKLVAARSDGDEPEIPTVTQRSDRGERGDRADRGGERGDRGARRPGGRAEGGREARGGRARKEPSWSAARLWIGAGRRLKMRPADLVGAIANEAGLDASQIGAIQIADGYSTVEVPDTVADEVIAALRGTKIKGLRVQVRRDRMGR